MDQIHLRPVSIQLMKNIVRCIFFGQRNRSILPIEKIGIILNKSLKSIKNGIFMLKELKILLDYQNFQLNEEVYEKLNNNCLVEKILFEYISRFPLFSEYLYLLRRKLQDVEPSILLKNIFNLKISENVIKSTFNGWIKFFEIEIEQNTANELLTPIKSIKDETMAILFIRENLYHNLSIIPKTVINDLIEGIINAENHPDNSLTDTGRAIENFLRINYGKIIDLKNCNGITQISNKLRGHKMISRKHHNILVGLGSIRSIGDAHGLDKEENKLWEVSKNSALLFSALTIKTINSIQNYNDGSLSF